MGWRSRNIPPIFLLFAWTGIAWASEKSEMPDFVVPEDTSGILDEFAFLEEASGLDEVQSASKHRQSIFWSPSAVTIFTREDLRASAAQSLTDLLRRIPGFDVYEIKTSWPLVGARALTDLNNNLVLVLVDGRETLVEMTGFTIWVGMTFSEEEIERIEVIRGPGSALYGANAFSAVVNITTVSDLSGPGANAYMVAGEQGFLRMHGRVRDSWAVQGGELFLSAAVNVRGEDFPSWRSLGSDQLAFHGYLQYRQKDNLELSAHGGFSDMAGFVASEAGEARADDVQTHWEMLKAEFLLGPDSKLKAQLYHNRFKTDLLYPTGFYSYGLWVFDMPHLWATVDSVDGQVQFDWRMLEQLLIITGINLRHSWFADSQGFILGKESESRGALFAQLEWRYEELVQLTGGLRFDMNSVTEPAVSPRLVAVFRPREQHSFRLAYGLAFRKPAWLEHGMHFQVEDYNPALPGIVEKVAESFGNPDLQNENVHSIEAGWRSHLLEEKLRLSVDLFYNLYRDTIHFFVHVPQSSMGLPDLANATISFQNTAAEANAMGGEFEASWQLDPQWKLWGNLALRYVTEKESGERMKTEPVLQANLGVRYLPPSGLRADVYLGYVSEYDAPLVNPAESGLLQDTGFITLGNQALFMAQLAYAIELGREQILEVGLNLRYPLGGDFREFPGGPYPPGVVSKVPGESMGELLTRRVAFFLRADL